ncbi:recombination protein NinG [Flavobacteriaceae bacterium]|nr:recombination protein NinG [Flavobacteriaceae bacterium]
MTAKRKCKHCGTFGYDHIRTPTGSFCSFEHSAKWAMDKSARDKDKALKKAVKADDKKHAARKRTFYDNDRSTRMKAAQTAFNAFIRARDAKLPCISCGRSTGCKMNAGHFKSVGAHPELRFNELNCHLQCEHCNSFKSGNISLYIPNLIEKIGLLEYEKLNEPHKAKKYTCAELKEIEFYYKQKLKQLARFAPLGLP